MAVQLGSQRSKDDPEVDWEIDWARTYPPPSNLDAALDEEWGCQFPLSTSGRHIVNVRGERFKLLGINWYGASDAFHVVGGLEKQSLDTICRTVRQLGFNVVRLPFSNEMLRKEKIEGAIDYQKNPKLRGLSAVQVYDEVVRCLGIHHIAVIVNNHTTYGEFCGPPSQNSLWFEPGGPFTEEMWINDWVMIAKRYQRCRHVVGFDLRNEIRPRGWMLPKFNSSAPRLGGCCLSCPDWARAASVMAKQISLVSPHALLIVERIVWPQSPLEAYVATPGPLLPSFGDKLVLGVHVYQWSGPGRFIPPWSIPPRCMPQCLIGLSKLFGLITRRNYGDMTRDQLHKQAFREWGQILQRGQCPVWVSEFGADLNNSQELDWFEDFVHVLQEADVDWAYWPLNVGTKPGCDADCQEAYGMIGPEWTPKSDGDYRLSLLHKIGLTSQPGIALGGIKPKPSLASTSSRLFLADKDPLIGMRSMTSMSSLRPQTRMQGVQTMGELGTLLTNSSSLRGLPLGQSMRHVTTEGDILHTLVEDQEHRQSLS